METDNKIRKTEWLIEAITWITIGLIILYT